MFINETNIYKVAYTVAKAQHNVVEAELNALLDNGVELAEAETQTHYWDIFDTMLDAQEQLLNWAFEKVQRETNYKPFKAQIDLVWEKRNWPEIEEKLINLAMKLQ